MDYEDASGQFAGTSRFYGEAGDGTAYALKIDIRGDDEHSDLALNLWATDSSSLTGLYFNVIYYIAKRMQEERKQEYIVLDKKAEEKAPAEAADREKPEAPRLEDYKKMMLTRHNQWKRQRLVVR